MDLNKMLNDGLAELAKLLLQKESLEEKIKNHKANLIRLEVVINYEKDKESKAKESEVLG